MRRFAAALVVLAACSGDDHAGVSVDADVEGGADVEVAVTDTAVVADTVADTVEDSVADTDVVETIDDASVEVEVIEDTTAVEVIEDTTAVEVVEDTTTVEDTSEPEDTSVEVVEDTTVEDTSIAETIDDTSVEVIDDTIEPVDTTPPPTCPELPCDGDDVCLDGACVPAGEPCDYAPSSRLSIITSLRLGNQDPEKDPETGLPKDACCVDFTNDGKVDNQLGTILAAAAALTGDTNDLFSQAIASGSLMTLVEARDVASLSDDDACSLYGFDGIDADGSLSNNASGLGTFDIAATSFEAGTAIPRTRFDAASIHGGVLTTTEGTTHLAFDLAGAPLDVRIERATLVADVALGPNGQGLALDGQLGGVLRRRELIAGLNDFMSTCACASFPDDVDGKMITIAANGTAHCNEAFLDGTCDTPCENIPTYCGVFLAIVTADVDLDGDGKTTSLADGISIGVFLATTSATLLGIEACPP